MWLTCNLSLKHPYIIQQTLYKNTQINQAEDVTLLPHQILITT